MKEEIAQEEEYHISSDAVNSDEVNMVLNYSNTFAVFDRSGNIHPHGKMVQGIYHQGTRFINTLILHVNGEKPLLLSGSIKEGNAIYSADLTNPILKKCNIPENSVHIERHQFVREGAFYEEIKVLQYEPKSCSFDLSLDFDGDFRDIFEIRGMKRKVETNNVYPVYHHEYFETTYLGLDGVERSFEVYFQSDVEYTLERNQAVFFINLTPKKVITIQYCIHFLTGKEKKETISYAEASELNKFELNQSKTLFADIKTSNAQFNHWLYRSEKDFISLLSQTDHGKYPYAGVPWYNTPFGRDGIIAAMETLWINPEITKGVLLFLAANQANDLIPEKDAEPGKILHEARNGEMANTGEIPFKQYYGTIDATPLFIMLAGMYYDRTADLNLIKQIWLNIIAAIDWIDNYGDIDGDGFVEYIHKSKNGLTNQGWKDSFDSIMHENNQLAEPPIALCEVQSYVYGAKKHAAKLALELGEQHLSSKLFNEAAVLKKNFNAHFWDEELSTFVLALDGQKRPCRVKSSNAGHCLFTGIADKDKAIILADTLLHSDMFSGWGVRTLSSLAGRYNPMSYHNGSIWPHDNALIAYGLSKYGLQKHVLRIMESIFDASLFIELQRVPELYCGFDKRQGIGPTAYPVACSPQAWAVGAVFMLLQSCLRIDINAINKTITFDRIILPDYLNEIYLTDLKLGNQKCTLIINRSKYGNVGFNILHKPDDWEIVIN
ncbi:amylo-alpha-1,6-glucosidase [Sphingobacterium corticibacterium]|uniref:Amylo-alpha-1,6-glucosidase n=1 Tax=Sphingobacterium corticibacterium TaxID=2484746 RepID=A0A4Q6XRQ5_9SPHI|nr:amylo-alpha-1,6-glucosidase [Sphingobacterium corticibacterium]RZF62621.1 amylo-alpha-1,6-glucosidase [Sphingobacterium corticibacterium]